MATKEKTVHISKIKDKTGKKKLSFTLNPITPEKLSPEVLMGLVYDMGVDDDGTLWIVNGNHEKKIIGRFVLYNTEGISITVSPQIVYVGQRKQISITASLTVPANRITLYRNSEEIYHVEDSISLEYPDIIVPATTDNIVYKVVAVIGSETKTNEATVTVEEDTIESITWTGYSISPSTVQVGMPAAFIEGIVTAIYKSGRQEDLTSSAVFSAHRGSITGNVYVAPSIAGEDTIRVSYNGKIAEAILTVTIVEEPHLTVQVGHGADYADAMFTDTNRNLSNNMFVNIDKNAGDYIFIKVDKRDTVNNLYIYNEGGGIFEYIEIAMNASVIDGNYKYYQSANRYNAGTAIPYVINKV